MGAIFRWVKYIYEWCKNFAYALSGNAFGYYPPYDQGVQFYVDGAGGLDTNDGKSWAKAFKTIAVARAAANAIVAARGGGIGEYSTIWIRPGVYKEHDMGLPFHCHMIGLGIGGYEMVRIKPDAGTVEDPVSCIFKGNSQGTHLANLWMEIADNDKAIIDAGVLNSFLMEDCVLRPGDGKTGVIGIRTETSDWLEIRRCVFQFGALTPLAYAMHFLGGAGRKLHAARIHDNDIIAEAGIRVEATAGQAVIKHNVVVASVGIGIYDGVGEALIVGNDVYAPTDPIETVGGPAQTIRNRTQVGAAATADWETPD